MTMNKFEIRPDVSELSTYKNEGKKSKIFHKGIISDIQKMIRDGEQLCYIKDQTVLRFRGYLRSRWKKAQRDWDLYFINNKPVKWKGKAVQFPKLSRGYGKQFAEKVKMVCEHYEKMPYLVMNLKLDQKMVGFDDSHSIFNTPNELKKEYQQFVRRMRDKKSKTHIPDIHTTFATMLRVGNSWIMRVVIVLTPKSKKQALQKGYYQKMMGKLQALWRGPSNFLSITRGGGLVKKFYEHIEPLLTANWDDDDITLTQGILMISSVRHWYHGDEVSKLLKKPKEHKEKICPKCRISNDGQWISETAMEWVEEEKLWRCPHCGYEIISPYDKIETYTTSGPDDHGFFKNRYLEYFSLDTMLEMIELGQVVKKKEWTKTEVKKLNIPKLPKFNLDGLGAIA